ncbi:type II toxin-antitoxin system RelB/DinJ family antitoxin [Streptococcus suis]|uniref:type II toxin-antitoxin system RelB/DinJ family antitoxin n=1 Tax=Streptococcus suis TaxID=1307 RepID=UPI0014324AF8|nr:type II toxin-antitoxin system RelB/DinJ family antitoxin [Streptococcus suis]NJW41276.1 type II toxin-antitoxin system RelB/DinJ family antitoxin [Streptococcus suis]
MKNIQVRVDDYVKDEADKLFKALGTTTNEAIKIFLKMSLNNKGFPFPIRIESDNMLDRIEGKMLPLSDEMIAEAYPSIVGEFYRNAEFDEGVIDEIVQLKGFLDEYSGEEEVDLAEAHLKIIDIIKQDLLMVADADSGDYELVAWHLIQTDLLEDVEKVAILDEYFVFSRQISASMRVQLFMNSVLPYLADREVELLAFMNAGFWRTEQIEEQKALLLAFKECGIEVISRGQSWGEMIHFVDLRVI